MHTLHPVASHPFQHTALTQLMNRSVSSNYLSPCFLPTQIFVATIAFLLPSAEHSTVEADKKVHVGKEGTWNGRDLKALDLSCWNGAFAEECIYWSALFSPFFLSNSPSLHFLCCSHPLPVASLKQSLSFLALLILHFCFDVNWPIHFLTSSVDGFAAALPVGLVHGCALESPAGAHHHAFSGWTHFPQGPTAGLHLQGG